MLLSLLPGAAFAAGETGTFTKITAQEELTDGKYVMVVETGYAAGALDGTWLSTLQVTDEGDSLTDPDASLVWDVAVTADGVTLTDANGVQIAPKGGNNNGIQDGTYTWAFTFADGAFRFLGTGEDTVTLASNKNTENKFRAYKNTTINAGYPCDFTLYQYVEGTGSTEPEPEPEPEPETISIAQALAAEDGAEGLTVKGVVTLIDGKNLYLQDETGGICAYLSSSPTGVALGDTVIATGNRATYSGLPELSGASFEKSSGLTLSPAVKTIGELTEADICTYVTIQNLTVTEVFDNNGQYTSPNITLQDTDGKSIQLYKAVVDKNEDGTWAVAVDDVVNVTAAVGVYNTTLQLRNTIAGEIQPAAPAEPEPETISIAQALAAEDGAEGLTVKGVVTLIDGKNLYLQDETGGICAYLSSSPTGVALGDTVIATGNRATYSGLPELSGASFEKSSGLTLSPAVKTIGELTEADICTYVTIQNLTVTEVFDNNGQYTSPNITLQDTDGKSIQLYKAVVDKNEDGTWAVAVDDVVNVTAAVGVYNTTLQLRNTIAGEIAKPGASAGPIYNGEQVVIYNPAYGKALSTAYNDYYNMGTDVTLTGGTLTGFTAADVWTVTDNGDGTWSFSYGGQNLGMADSYTSMTLGEKFDKWELVDAGGGLWYVKNPDRDAYMEYQDNYGTWSAYYNIAAGSEGMFALSFYEVTELPEPPSGEVEFPESFVIYNVGAQGVLAAQDDNETSPSVNAAAASLSDGAATPANGARVFIVEENGEYYRFKTADGYLSSNGTGNNAFYQAEATEDSDWTVTAFNGGYNLMSRTAKFNGKYDQYLEYYGGSYKTYSLYSDSGKDIYTFFFYPLADGVTVTEGVVNVPAVSFGTLAEAYAGQAYTLTFTVDSVFGVQELSVKYGETAAEPASGDGVYSITIPAGDMKEGTLTVTVTGTDAKGVDFTGSIEIPVKDEPYILDVFPAPSSQTGDDKAPEIGFTFVNAGENPTITLSVGGQAVTPVVEDGKASYTPTADLADGKLTVTATVTRADEKSVTRTWTFTVGKAQYQLYFGQLHSHTKEYSDGAGTLQEGLDYVASLPESANVDFVAFTDHSNYFDSTSDANPEAALYDISQMTAESKAKWDAYTGQIDAFNAAHAGEIVALAGFEMTWSGGPGHINTFNTPGIVSRNNTTLNNKTADAGMQAYYALLSNENLADSISQFNHPGTTFGNFADFGYYDPIIDTRMYLVEVGNGEGAIGAGGYYPSYEQYIMALDKGWHLAPTNNQDNHKGKWGNANDARDVILTDDFSEEGIYEAIRNYRVYATEDKNLEISYTLNGQMLGSIIEEIPESAVINVSVYDPDSSDSISKVEVVVNSGAVAYTWDDPTQLASGELNCTIPAEYSYYFIRVTQGDGDIAVTAPVWVGEVVKLGISSVACGTSTPVTGEALTLTTTLFNSETAEATVKSITYTSGSQTLYTDNTARTIPASSTLAVDWSYVPDTARVMSITVTAVIEEGGIAYSYSKSVTLDILDASQLVYIGIDASHYNEYVNGNYKDSMGNFGTLAAGYSVRTVQLNTSDELIAACENDGGKYVALVLTAPSRRDGDSLRDPYVCYSEQEIQAIAAFNAAGGTVIVAGWGDFYESYKDFPAEDHMAAQQNLILEALGSHLRISDDELKDDSYNGGQPQRLYLSSYNFDSFLLDRVEFDADNPHDNLYTELFSQYGGASIHVVDGDGQPTTAIPDTVTPVVYAFDTGYSADDDKDNRGGLGTIPEYAYGDGTDRLLALATEDLGGGKGLIVVSGAAFLSNFEVQATISDSGAEKNYSNYKICENLVNYLNPTTISEIAEVQAQKQEGIKYVVEGVVTSNASGYDKDTAFFDCIYVQDDTAGINAFPVAGDYKIGDKVRITGTTSSYQGERQLNVTAIEKIGEVEPLAPKSITTREAANSTYLGSLVQLQGVVVSFAEAEGSIQTIMVRDESGYDARVFIDGYITQDKTIENLAVGHEITVVGLSSYDNSFDGPAPRIRVRDRAEITCGTEVVDIPPAYSGGSSGGGSSSSGNKTEVVTNPDGSTTTTVTKPDGSSSATTKFPDNTTTITNTDKDGNSETTVKVPEQVVSAAAEKSESFLVSMPQQSAAGSMDAAPSITLDLADKTDIKVEIPVKDATSGTVAIRVDKDGSEEILKDTALSGNGITVTLSDGDTIKIVDNAKSFTDVSDTHWAKDSIDYVTSRSLFEGTSASTFTPAGPMTRAMGWTMLARHAGVDTSSGTTWYEAGQTWSMEEAISDGSSPEGDLTREQLVTMLYRYVDSPAAEGDLSVFADAVSVSGWAYDAMVWAVSLGLVEGVGENRLAPQNTISRAEVATLFARFAAQF